jgi:hypothetical protein
MKRPHEPANEQGEALRNRLCFGAERNKSFCGAQPTQKLGWTERGRNGGCGRALWIFQVPAQARDGYLAWRSWLCGSAIMPSAVIWAGDCGSVTTYPCR